MGYMPNRPSIYINLGKVYNPFRDRIQLPNDPDLVSGYFWFRLDELIIDILVDVYFLGSIYYASRDLTGYIIDGMYAHLVEIDGCNDREIAARDGYLTEYYILEFLEYNTSEFIQYVDFAVKTYGYYLASYKLDHQDRHVNFVYTDYDDETECWVVSIEY